MKQKFNELLDRPWTTRGYLKAMTMIYGTPIVIGAMFYIIGRWTDICNWFKSKFSKKKTEKETK